MTTISVISLWSPNPLSHQDKSLNKVSFLTVLADLKDRHGAVVQSAQLLPEGAHALLVRRLMGRQHLLHLSQRGQQVVSGRTVLWVGTRRG